MKTKAIRLEVVRRRLDELTEDVEGDLAREGWELARPAPDHLDVARQLTQVHIVQEVSRLLDRQREELEHALERARVGVYGICEDCEQEIEAERLRFRPESTRCVSCQSKQDPR
jgi:DnaK suppressor protein